MFIAGISYLVSIPTKLLDLDLYSDSIITSNNKSVESIDIELTQLKLLKGLVITKSLRLLAIIIELLQCKLIVNSTSLV